jgi:hypothetical protein
MAKEAKKAEDGKELAKAGTTALAGMDDMMQEAAELGGAGRTKGMEDNQVPFISLLQDLSPEVKKRDPAYIEGAEPGFIINKGTQKIYAGDTGLIVQPWASERVINKWIPREAGGGYQGRFPLTGTVEETMKALGASQRPDPKDPTKFDWIVEDTGHQLIDTRYVYVNVLENGRCDPAVVAFSSTGHTVAKKWSTLRNASRLPNGAEHPIWFKKYRMRSQAKKNNKGDFFVLAFDDLGDEGFITDASIRNMARSLHEAFAAGSIRAADGDGSDAGGDAGEDAEKSGL